MAAAASDLAPNSESAVVSRIPTPIHYVCGRFLSLKKPVVILLLMAAITTIWGLKEKRRRLVCLCFCLKTRKRKKRVLRDGPWFYGGSMLVLADYDGLSPLEAVDLNHLEIWVAVKGLRIGMRDDLTLSRFRSELGEFIDVDPAALRCRDLIQRIRIRHDVRRRILSRRWFVFSPEFPVLLETRYEKCHGICADCGFFGHGGGACDKGLVAAAGPSARGTAEAGYGKTPATVVTPELDASRSTSMQNSSAGKSHGLTAKSFGQQRTLVNGPDSEVDGLHLLDVGSGPLGSAGLKSNFDDSSDLDEPLFKLKKRSRPYGSKNKGPSKKKKKPGSSLVTFPMAKAAEIVCPEDKGKSAT